jgi:hypothetical protein
MPFIVGVSPEFHLFLISCQSDLEDVTRVFRREEINEFHGHETLLPPIPTP